MFLSCDFLIMVPPENVFLSLRLPIFDASYFQCFTRSDFWKNFRILGNFNNHMCPWIKSDSDSIWNSCYACFFFKDTFILPWRERGNFVKLTATWYWTNWLNRYTSVLLLFWRNTSACSPQKRWVKVICSSDCMV